MSDVNSPRERADKVGEALANASLVFDGEGFAVEASETRRVSLLLPPGSLVLTADEAETVRRGVKTIVPIKELPDGRCAWSDEAAKALALLSPEAGGEGPK